MSISVSISDQQDALEIDRRRLRDIVRRTLQSEGIDSAAISVALVDDPAMHVLNRRHLDHDYPTDVLSFLLAGGPGGGGSKRLEGEIIISTDTAIRQAREYEWEPQAELALYLVHGLLHLCGYDDHRAKDRREMRRREADILQFWGLSPHYDE